MEGIKVISMLVALGAVTYMAYAVIAGSAEFGDPSYDVGSTLLRGSLVFGVAVLINVVAGRFQKRK